jgi:hypothetical protein
MSRPFVRTLWTLVSLLPMAFARTDTSSLSGTVTDPSGGGVPSANISLKSKATGAVRNAVMASHGWYQFNLIASGVYEVTVEAPGSNEVLRRQRSGSGSPAGEVESAAQTVLRDGSLAKVWLRREITSVI